MLDFNEIGAAHADETFNQGCCNLDTMPTTPTDGDWNALVFEIGRKPTTDEWEIYSLAYEETIRNAVEFTTDGFRDC